MKALTTAIYNELTGSAINRMVNGSIYKGRAPSSARYPYIVFFVVSDTQGDTFKSKIDEYHVQFSIFSSNSSSTEIDDIYDTLKRVFDDAVLRITGATQCLLFRENTVFNDEEVTTPTGTEMVWHYAVDYQITIEEG